MKRFAMALDGFYSSMPRAIPGVAHKPINRPGATRWCSSRAKWVYCSMPRKVAAVRAPAADNGKLQIDVQAAGPERHVIRFTILKNMELKILMKSFIEHMFENHTELAVKE